MKLIAFFFYICFFFFFFPTGTRHHYFPFVITGILVMIAVIAVACCFGKQGKSSFILNHKLKLYLQKSTTPILMFTVDFFC